jgi:hypothetical protein
VGIAGNGTVEKMARKTSSARRKRTDLPIDVDLILRGLEDFLNATDELGRKPCSAKYGVYAFYDYDGEPIYVGQTKERLRVRIRRHMSNQRTDAVAMRVLDPLEVAEIGVWPFWEFEGASGEGEAGREIDRFLNAAEYTLYRKVISESSIGRVLNEKVPAVHEEIQLPPVFRGSIVPEDLRVRLEHPDLRIARRSQKIAELAGIISQRNVSVGLRNTLVTQAERLLSLARERYLEIAAEKTPDELESETIGTDPGS